MAKTRGVRLSDEVSAWVDEYSAARGVDASTVLRTAVESFMEDAKAGVPAFRELVRRQSSVAPSPGAGVGDCPKREDGGHVWASHRVDPERSCVFGCGAKGREAEVSGVVNGGFFARASGERAGLVSGLRPPASSGWKAGRSGGKAA